MKKRMLAFVVLLFLLTGTLALTATAADVVASGKYDRYGIKFTWMLDDEGTLTISGSGGMPTWYDETNSERTPWFSHKKNITAIVIESGVTHIGRSAFYGCSALTSVKIPDSVTNIGAVAFCGCSALTSIQIPNSVTDIGGSAFSGCSGLTSATIPENVTSISGRMFYGCSGLTSVTIPENVTSIGDYAFYGCSGLTGMTIPENVTSIGDCAFYRCSGLTGVTLPDSVTSIGNQAFYGCSGLISVTLPDSVASIGDGTFYGCSELASILIPDSVASIGDFAFYGCSKLTNVAIPDSVTSIGERTFWNCSELTSVAIPDSVAEIGDQAFSGCSGLTDIIVGDGITSLDAFAFSGFSEHLKTIKIGNGVTSIRSYAFSNCSSLTSVKIGNSVASIGHHAFSGCSGLTSVTIPDSVTSIEEYTFNDCSGLTSIKIGDGVTNIEKSAFYGCSALMNVTISDSVTSIGEWAFVGCDSLTSVTIPDSVTEIGSLAFNGCKGLTSVTIPDSVTSIGGYAFAGCSGLTNVKISNSVTEIGNYVFSACSGLTSVTIPESVTSIGSSAFQNCSGLTSILIPDSVSSIGNEAFSGCSGLTSVTIPESVTSIGSSAFQNCSGLTSILIPDSVTSINQYAFSGCSALIDVYYTGREEQWNNVSGYNFLPPTAVIHYLAEPTPNNEKLGMTQENNQWTVTAGGDITVTVQLLDGSDFDAGRVLWSNTGVGIAEITDKGQKDANSAYAVLRGRFPGKTTLTATLTAPLGSSDMRSVSTSQEITVVASGDIWFPTSASRYVVASGQTIDIYAYIDNLPTGDANKVAWETGDSGNAVVVKKESSGPIFSSPVLVSARLTGYVAGETSLTVTAPDGRSASIPVLVTNSKTAQNVIVTPTASGSLNVENVPPETPPVSWLWDKDSGLLEIKGSGAIHDYASYDETPWASYRNEIKTVKLYDGVTGVGKNAFRNCMTLQEVTIPKTLVSVSENAFAGDSKLKKANFDGTPEEWKMLVSNMASGNEPLKNLKREQLTAYSSQVKVPMSDAYHTTEYQPTWSDAVNTAWNTLKKTIEEDYMSKVKSGAKKASATQETEQAKIKGYSKAELITKFGALSSVKNLHLEVALSGLEGSVYGRKLDENRRKAIENALYEMLYEEFTKDSAQSFKEFKIGAINLNTGKFGKIDISNELITVQIIKSVADYFTANLSDSKLSSKKTTDGDTVELYYNPIKLGYFIHVSGEDIKDQEVELAIPDSTVSQMAEQYMNELCAQTKTLMKQAFTQYLNYLGEITGFTDAFKGIAAKDVKGAINELLQSLGLRDQWGLGENAYKINEIYKAIKPVSNDIGKGQIPSATKLNATITRLRAIGELSGGDQAVSDATKQLVNSINTSLATLITNLMANPEKSASDAVEEWAKSQLENARKLGQGVTDIVEWTCNKIGIRCPVDFRIYDASSACVGYVENGMVWCDDRFLIEVNGECKTVYIPGDMEVRFEFTGTNNGTMTYVMEEVRNGITVGRKNYYDIPLTEGASYTQTFKTGSDLTSLQTNPVISSDGDSIFANEYLDAKDESLDASVYVDCVVEGEGTVSGFGNFPKGNAVSLFACPEDGMEFVGWSENGVLVSADSLYQFAARENRELHAVFRKPYEENDEYEISVNDEYPYSVGLAVYQDKDALAHIAITPLSGQDTTDLSQVKAKRYRLDGTLYAEQTLDAAYDLKYSYWLPATDVSECAKLELFDKSEQLIAVLFSEEWDAKNPPTLSYRNLQRSADRVSLTAKINNPSSADVSGQIIVAAYNSDGKMLNCSIIPDVSLTTNSEAEKSAEITCQGNGNTATVKLFFLDDAWVPLASALAVM